MYSSPPPLTIHPSSAYSVPSPLTPSSKLRVIMEMEGPTRIGAEREVKQSDEKGRNQIGTRTTRKPKHDKIKKIKKEQYGEYFVQKKWNKLRVKK